MSFVTLLVVSAVVAGFVALWYLLGSRAGILWTPRALTAGAVLSLLGVLGHWYPSALDIMLLADLALVILIWVDAALARRVTVIREPLPGLSVGHTGEVTYRWTNDSRRLARLWVREVRPTILGGLQAARALTIPARATTREDIPVVPVRRGRESSGSGELASTTTSGT